VYDRSHTKKRGGVVHTQNNQVGVPQGVSTQAVTIPISHHRGFTTKSFANRDFANRVSTNQGFTTVDILWALGIWSVIICLSPVIVFYMLMVA
jgi:hypothetical protein